MSPRTRWRLISAVLIGGGRDRRDGVVVLMRNGVLRVVTPTACFGMIVRDWVVVEAAPYAKRFLREFGRTAPVLEERLRARGYEVTRWYG